MDRFNPVGGKKENRVQASVRSLTMPDHGPGVLNPKKGAEASKNF